MAGGWAKDGAVQDQIDASVEDAVAHARQQLHQGESLEYCEECDAKIPEARRKAVPGYICASNARVNMINNRPAQPATTAVAVRTVSYADQPDIRDVR